MPSSDWLQAGGREGTSFSGASCRALVERRKLSLRISLGSPGKGCPAVGGEESLPVSTAVEATSVVPTLLLYVVLELKFPSPYTCREESFPCEETLQGVFLKKEKYSVHWYFSNESFQGQLPFFPTLPRPPSRPLWTWEPEGNVPPSPRAPVSLTASWGCREERGRMMFEGRGGHEACVQ